MPLVLFFEVFAAEHEVSSCPGNDFYYRSHKKLIIVIRLVINGPISKTYLCNISTVSLRYYRWVLERNLMLSKKRQIKALKK